MTDNKKRPSGALCVAVVAANGIAKLCGLACALAMITMALSISAEIVARNCFHYSFRSVEEISGYLIVAITFLGLAVAVNEDALFRVEILLERFSAPARRLAEIGFFSLFIFFLAVIDYQAVALVVGSWERGYVASTLLATPLYLPQLLIPVGLTATIGVSLVKMLVVLTGTKVAPVSDEADTP